MIPEAQTGMVISCDTVFVQPNSIKMVGENADTEAAVISQQKKQRVNRWMRQLLTLGVSISSFWGEQDVSRGNDENCSNKRLLHFL